MKIQYASDLHLEFPENRTFLYHNPLEPVADVLILAGDICHFKLEHFSDYEFFDYISANWKQVYLIPGNHEFYGKCKDVSDVIPDFEWKVRDNVTYLNNKPVKIDDTVFLFTTLWTHIRNPYRIEQGMNDFRQSTFKGKRLRARDHNLCNQTSLHFLDRHLSIMDDDEKVVVVTHHVPFSDTYCNYPFVSDLSEGFHNDLNDMMRRHRIDYWIYGHNHHNMPDFEIEGVKLLTNQLGYTMYDEHGAFKRNAYFEI